MGVGVEYITSMEVMDSESNSNCNIENWNHVMKFPKMSYPQYIDYVSDICIEHIYSSYSYMILKW